ncbi:hypothetical protein GU3_00005 [Oceanimonas sp. GK1]|nr:hypothetical protein GU3_00005 [Oceanimonas sp. GK1]
MLSLVRAAYSTPSYLFVKHWNRSFYCLLTVACSAVSVRAHYREPRFLRKGFFDKKRGFSTERLLTQQNHMLATELYTDPALLSGFRYYIALSAPNKEMKA